MRVIPPEMKTEGLGPSFPLPPPTGNLSWGSGTDISSSEVRCSSNYDPDIPIPSVESENTSIPLISPELLLSRSHRACMSTTAMETPRIFTPEPSEESDVQEMISPHQPRPHIADSIEKVTRQTQSPSSIPPPPSTSLLQPPSEDDGLLSSMETLKIHDQEQHSQTPLRPRQMSSPSPSRRRRSGSAIIREIHRVEDEEPPEADKLEVQKAFATALSCISNTASVLSSSNLHLEPDSTTHKLYHEALTLAKFQLPSSRIVGLIGDSAAGKSSLINSLLDKPDLARAVCTFD